MRLAKKTTHRVRTEPERAGSVGFLGGALRCLADSEAPPKKKKKEYPTAIRGELLLHSHHISTH